MICNNCHSAHLLDHPEQSNKYCKCPICGFTIIKPPTGLVYAHQCFEILEEEDTEQASCIFDDI